MQSFTGDFLLPVSLLSPLVCGFTAITTKSHRPVRSILWPGRLDRIHGILATEKKKKNQKITIPIITKRASPVSPPEISAGH